MSSLARSWRSQSPADGGPEPIDGEARRIRAEKLVSLAALSAGIAHETGSSLAVIRGRAELMLRDCAGTDAEGLRLVIKHVDQITATIGRVLELSRPRRLATVAIPLRGSVAGVRARLRPALERHRVQLRVQLEKGLPPLAAAESSAVVEVLVNLLLNACEASAPGQSIWLRAYASDRQVRIEVIDHGRGIAPEHRHAVFDPFFTTKKGGQGLGLTVAATIVRNHGGEIDLSSEGGGTTATLRWPAAIR